MVELMKKYLSLVILVFLCAMLFAGCSGNKNADVPSTDEVIESFMDIRWTRDADHDTETICFGKDGSFSYSCSCGNPVNDSDLCEGYTYNDATKTITLNYTEPTMEMVKRIRVVKCDETSLHLDFDGELRIFEK